MACSLVHDDIEHALRKFFAFCFVEFVEFVELKQRGIASNEEDPKEDW